MGTSVEMTADWPSSMSIRNEKRKRTFTAEERSARCRHNLANALSTLLVGDRNDPPLKGQAALCFCGKPLSLQFLDEGRAVDLKQLGGFAGDPVGAAKRADNETMLELLEFT